MAFLCGAGSFSRAEDGELWPPSTPLGSKRRLGTGGGNPYSTRGLEKFSMLLADLETRKERIVAAAGSQGVALVQFVYSSSDDWVPIVVRPREQPRAPAGKKRRKEQKRPGKTPQEILTLPPPPQQQQQSPAADQAEAARDRAVRKSQSWKANGGEGGGVWLWRPSRYLPVAVVLVLLCLAVFGRAFAICCTSMWWYAVPVAAAKGGGNREPRRSVKEYGRRARDRRLGGAAAEGVGVPAAKERRGGALEGLASPRKQHIMKAS
ncbi:hypothetical protein Taro_002513 [Colocasia esculenta]|uniref:Uncharacterized protein n=1 Tax=Colocasia esculenta TaxID=4460 RepID=A0A843TCW6_COLES|nr:hypothetical protein [Colocasia esculenta]